MYKTLSIIVLVVIIIGQYGWSVLRESAGRSSFSIAVVRSSLMVFDEIRKEKDPKKKDALLDMAISETQKQYEYKNGNTDLFYRIIDGITKMQ